MLINNSKKSACVMCEQLDELGLNGKCNIPDFIENPENYIEDIFNEISFKRKEITENQEVKSF